MGAYTPSGYNTNMYARVLLRGLQIIPRDKTKDFISHEGSTYLYTTIRAASGLSVISG